jgi:hypothetical protein
MTGIAIRLFLISSVALSHNEAGRKFSRLFPVLLVFDAVWAVSPLLAVPPIPRGVALAGVAGLAYLPFTHTHADAENLWQIARPCTRFTTSLAGRIDGHNYQYSRANSEGSAVSTFIPGLQNPSFLRSIDAISRELEFAKRNRQSASFGSSRNAPGGTRNKASLYLLAILQATCTKAPASSFSA